MRIFLTVLLAALTGVVMADPIEEPKWDLLHQFDDVEIRQYAPRVQATTRLKNAGATNGGFRRLAGYIFGGNDQQLSIAMTAPVQTTLETDETLMAFNMPANFTLAQLPAPESTDITLTEVPARTVAALRFSGWATDGKVESMTKALLATLQHQGIAPVGSPVLNQYNPPWTPPWKRRNEVVIAIDPGTTLL